MGKVVVLRHFRYSIAFTLDRVPARLAGSNDEGTVLVDPSVEIGTFLLELKRLLHTLLEDFDDLFFWQRRYPQK